ncbi:hypothetical protein [Butyrivibrio fibrisolvens]|uniref:hypothetical protein n=1 Tax=Butyrivibrio fibrisolvens TaxID=831 RepID=UPI0011B21A26|nr:hypothetical protein [Butyrivibrio fibrisolvens]
MRKINQLHWLDENEAVRNFMYKYGLREDETITGGLILGYSEAGEPIRELFSLMADISFHICELISYLSGSSALRSLK